MSMTAPLVKRSTTEAMLWEWPVDPIIVCSAMLLLVIGLVMVGSASTEISDRTYGNPLYLFFKHGAYLVVAVTVALVALSVPIRIWQKLDWLLLLASFALLIAVLVPGIGREVNGSSRWIPIGPFSLQGSEFVKLFSIVYVAGFLGRHREAVQQRFVSFLIPLGVTLLLAALLLAQPDFGAAVVILSAVMALIFLAGVPMRFFAPIIALCVAGAALVAVWQPYRLERLTVFRDPWQHQFDGGYQLTQALIAFGRGEWFGLGLGNSIQKLFFLPEAHTDFLFSIIAEELGIVGAVFLIVVIVGLVLRALWIGRLAEIRGQYFHAYLGYGVAMLLGIQMVINIGVNIGVLPTKGLTLPLVSFGGNSLIISCVLIAILLRIEYECRSIGLVKPAGAGKSGGRYVKPRR